jgi:hypothetical protein
MHRDALQIVYELGPAAIRPLNRSLCRFVDQPDVLDTVYPASALYWTVPESSRAIASVTRWLADPTHRDLFEKVDDWDLFPRLPQTAPSLAVCLRNPEAAREAAIGLGMMGTNAAQAPPAVIGAIPALVEVSENGVAIPPVQLKYHVVYGTKGEPYLMNRCAAFEALGRIGVASPDVLTAIDDGLVDAHEDVRLAALRCLGALRQPLAGRLTNTLVTLAFRRSIKIENLIEWVGTLKGDGEVALPWLRQFTQMDYLKSLPDGPDQQTGDFSVPANDFRLTAIVAVCQINPEATRQFLPDLIAEIGTQWKAVEFLTESKASAPEIVALLNPVLDDTNRMRAAQAAYVTLAFDPQHPQALAVLRDGVAHGSLGNRIIASLWLWERTGETNDVIPLCIEGLESSESYIGQNAANSLEKMGGQARASVPALKAALWHPDRYVRERAGKALRKIAPDEMPPIS